MTDVRQAYRAGDGPTPLGRVEPMEGRTWEASPAGGAIEMLVQQGSWFSPANMPFIRNY